jgi:hypothetical protein
MMKEGLPFSLSPDFISYFTKYGRGDKERQLADAYKILENITIAASREDQLTDSDTVEEKSGFVSSSSSVFTGPLIPVPVNKLASKGIRGRKKEK